jgi:hypothetical protein
MRRHLLPILLIALAMIAIAAWNWVDPGWPVCRTCFVSFRDKMEKRGMTCQSLPEQRMVVCYRNITDVTGQVIVEK